MTDVNQRKGEALTWDRIWRVGYSSAEVSLVGPVHAEKQELLTLRVHLDLDKGQLSFFDALQNIHLHTVTHKFTREVFPVFYTCKSLSILPLKPFVTIEQHKPC